jgi:hypothetical protein
MFPWLKKDLVIEEPDGVKQVLERDIRRFVPVLKERMQTVPQQKGFRSKNEWKPKDPTTLLFREIYQRDVEKEYRPASLFKEIKKDVKFKDFSAKVKPLHLFIDVGEYGKSNVDKSIHLIILPGFKSSKPAYKVVGFLESSNVMHFSTREYDSIGSAEFFEEVLKVAKSVQWRT